jgi:hypothetical protein
VDDRVTTGIEGHWLNDKPGASSEKSKSKMECALAPAVGAWGGGRGGCGAGFGPKWWTRGIRLVGRTSARSSVGVRQFAALRRAPRREVRTKKRGKPRDTKRGKPAVSHDAGVFLLGTRRSNVGAPAERPPRRWLQS